MALRDRTALRCSPDHDCSNCPSSCNIEDFSNQPQVLNPRSLVRCVRLRAGIGWDGVGWGGMRVATAREVCV